MRSAELIRHTVAATRQLPPNVLVRTADATATALHTGLIGYLNPAIAALSVDVHRTEIEARLLATTRAYAMILDPEM